MISLDTERDRIFLFTVEPGRVETRLAWLAGAAILLVSLLVWPFATHPLSPAPGLVAVYASCLSLGCLVIAILLFAQFLILGSAGLLVLANGSMFAAAVAILYLASDPGAFLLARGEGESNVAAWLSAIWHVSYPATVLAYGVVSRGPRSALAARARASTPVGIQAICGALVVLAAMLAVIVATRTGHFLPPLGAGLGWGAANRPVGVIVAAVAAAAGGVLFLRRGRSVLDLWLLVSMLAWLADALLIAACDARFELGWYVGRLFGGLSIGLLLLALLIESAALYGRLFDLNEALVVSNRALEHLSLHDALTGLPNRRYFDNYLGNQASLMRRQKSSLALVLCDVDTFKAFNDLYGHVDGDDCLARVALALKTCCRRPADLAARYGGEEFAMILPETDLKGAIRIADAARAAVARLSIPHAKGLAATHVTISCGVAAMDGETRGSVESLLEAADAALLRAKAEGRDRTRAGSLTQPEPAA